MEKEPGIQIMAFGYARGDEDAESPHELREVSILAPPAVLRQIAAHLRRAADEIDHFGDDFGHSHLRDEWEGWLEGAADIIVIGPGYASREVTEE